MNFLGSRAGEVWEHLVNWRNIIQGLGLSCQARNVLCFESVKCFISDTMATPTCTTGPIGAEVLFLFLSAFADASQGGASCQ